MKLRNSIFILTEHINQPYRIINSIPIPVCKFGRAHFHKIFKGFGATYGKCVFQKTYFRYKPHMLAIIDSFITDAVIISENIEDRVATWDLVSGYDQITIFKAKGYTGDNFITALNVEKEINILPIKKINSKV